jgi:hypothetical protein
MHSISSDLRSISLAATQMNLVDGLLDYSRGKMEVTCKENRRMSCLLDINSNMC